MRRLCRTWWLFDVFCRSREPFLYGIAHQLDIRFFTPRSYDGRLSVKYRYAKDSEFLWQPSEFILPTDTSLNLVFHKNSDSFPCSFALLPSFCCGVKSEIRPDVNVFLKKNSRQRFRRVVKSSFLASENIYLRRTKNENSQLLQLFATTLCN